MGLVHLGSVAKYIMSGSQCKRELSYDSDLRNDINDIKITFMILMLFWIMIMKITMTKIVIS